MIFLHNRIARRVLGCCAVLLGLAHALPAAAQLTPDRLYYGVRRDIPMTVKLPPNAKGDVAVELFAPDGASLGRAPAGVGGVNLSTMFPSLWTDAAPRLAYAQLVVGAERVGPPVVLQPLLSPPTAALVDPQSGSAWFVNPASKQANFDQRRGRIMFSLMGEKPAISGLRAYVDKHAIVETTAGPIEFALRPEAAPNTAWNFRTLVEGGFYTDILIHRIVASLPPPRSAPFVIQFGDPAGSGDGGPGYNLDLEQSSLPHDFGVLSMARAPDPNSAGSQVFICLSREGTSFLDGGYTSFAQAVGGTEAILAIAATPVDAEGRPTGDGPRVTSARLVDAPPFGTGPKPITRPETAAAPR